MNKNASLHLLPGWIKKIYAFLQKGKVPFKLVYILISVLATIWFLIRVIPKPTRATYPCMQAIAPFLSGLVIWLISLISGVLGIKKVKNLFSKGKYAYALGMAIIVSFAFFMLFSSNPKVAMAKLVMADVEPWFTPNMPIGEGKGIYPGRVVWAHNPDVTDFSGSGKYYTDESINQNETDKMLNEAIQKLTGKPDKAASWDA